MSGTRRGKRPSGRGETRKLRRNGNQRDAIRGSRRAAFARGGGVILNRQRTVRVPVRQLEEFAADARRAVGLPAESFSVCLVTNPEIARWNRAYRHKGGPTDVLSFPAEDETPHSMRGARRRTSGISIPATIGHYLGDIAIAPAVARRNARRFGRTLSQEMRMLILHGMLHLMGYDHETDTGQMDRRERRLWRQLRLA